MGEGVTETTLGIRIRLGGESQGGRRGANTNKSWGSLGERKDAAGDAAREGGQNGPGGATQEDGGALQPDPAAYAILGFDTRGCKVKMNQFFIN